MTYPAAMIRPDVVDVVREPTYTIVRNRDVGLNPRITYHPALWRLRPTAIGTHTRRCAPVIVTPWGKP